MPNQDDNFTSRLVLRNSADARLGFQSLSGRTAMNKLKSVTQPRRSRIGIAIAAALGLFSGVASAQSAPSTPPAQQAAGGSASDQPDEKVTELETVLVTASKRVENVREVASSISVIGTRRSPLGDAR